MLTINKFFTTSLVKANKFPYYIHLKDHNKKINPQKNQLALSFMNPKVLNQYAPKERTYAFNLRRKTQKELERKMFEQYKEKVLKGQIDEEQVIEVDPLWGQEDKPKHFYQNLSKTELMSVSHPQNATFVSKVDSICEKYFVTKSTQLPTAQQVRNMNPSQLVDAALWARHNRVDNLDFWNDLQKTLGNKFYELNSNELIQLNYALKGKNKRGTPRIHTILHDLFEQDLTKFKRQQLIALYYSFRNCKTEVVAFQDKILEHLEPFYSEMNFEEKVNWLLTYTISRKPQIFKRTENKILHQNQRKGHQLIFNLNFSNQIGKELSSVDQCISLIFSLAKLRAENTKFLTDEIMIYLKDNIQEITQNVQNSAKLLFYLEEVQGGSGVYDSQFFAKLIETVTEPTNFHSLSKVDQIRSIYAIWNYNLLTDDIFELYKSIQIEPDSTILHYFCEIQLSRSSERQWEVLRNLAELNHIPLPYYQSVRRFCNYIRVAVPEWDLTPIQEKLKNTQFVFDVRRGKDKFFKIHFYRNLMKHFKFSQQKSPFEHTVPIQNLQLTQFASTVYQVSVDIVNQSVFVPGTDSLKQSYRNKIKSLSNIGWKHVVLRQKQLTRYQANIQLSEVLFAYAPYVEEQTAVIQNKDYYRAEEIEALRNQQYWDSMTAQEAEGYRNNPEEYAKKLAEIAEKQKKLSEQLAKVQ